MPENYLNILIDPVTGHGLPNTFPCGQFPVDLDKPLFVGKDLYLGAC